MDRDDSVTPDILPVLERLRAELAEHFTMIDIQPSKKLHLTSGEMRDCAVITLERKAAA